MNYRKLLVLVLFMSTIQLSAQIPSGYYDNAQGLNGTELRQTLHDIIDNHNAQSYSALWTHLQETDRKDNNKVWDMYSDVPGGTPPYEFAFVSDQCGSYQAEGDCYNREHSWPKSWFNEDYPMYTDMFHVVPSDGYVNGQRGNHPYGETNEAFWISQNGSKVGTSSFSTMSGTVFEPIDAYKGDFARNYMYMVTRYYNEDTDWYTNDLVNGANFTSVGTALMLKWHEEDPVSQKEIDRNDAIYQIQGNRNPFIDHPEYASNIWGAVNTPPYFINRLTDTTLAEGETLELDIHFNDNEPESVSIEWNCLFCSADFISLTNIADGHTRLTAAPVSGDAGSYSVTIIANDGVNDSPNYLFDLVVEQGNAIPDIDDHIQIAPNPTSNTFVIKDITTHSGVEKVMVYNIAGQRVDSFILNQKSGIEFGSNYQQGTYIVKIISSSYTFTQKLVKR